MCVCRASLTLLTLCSPSIPPILTTILLSIQPFIFSIFLATCFQYKSSLNTCSFLIKFEPEPHSHPPTHTPACPPHPPALQQLLQEAPQLGHPHPRTLPPLHTPIEAVLEDIHVRRLLVAHCLTEVIVAAEDSVLGAAHTPRGDRSDNRKSDHYSILQISSYMYQGNILNLIARLSQMIFQANYPDFIVAY